MAEVRAYVNYEQVFVWKDGVLTGDPFYVQQLWKADVLNAGTRLGPPEGPFSEDNHLSTPLGLTYLLGAIITEDGLTLNGDVPEDRNATDADGNWLP